jgi:F-box protein 9
VHVSNLTDPAAADARHTFQMTLVLRSRPLGRWNRLDFHRYESVNVEDGEVLALPLKKERPFWFSKVRSYV